LLCISIFDSLSRQGGQGGQGGPFSEGEAVAMPGLIDHLQKLQAFTGSEFTANIDRDVIDRENFWHYSEKWWHFFAIC